MAVLNRKEEKVQAVLGRLPEQYTNDDFVEMFIKLFSSDWGKLKKAYNKQNQDKEPGTVVNMPKPELYLHQILALYLEKNKPVTKAKSVKEKGEKVKAEKPKVEKVSEKGKALKPKAQAVNSEKPTTKRKTVKSVAAPKD